MWQNMLDDSKEPFGEEGEVKLSLFEKCGDVLFGEDFPFLHVHL